MASEQARLGMGAPVPLSWEAIQPSGHAQTNYGGDDSQRLGQSQRIGLAPARLVVAWRRLEPVGRQERLLWWGRLLLEGG